MIIKSFSGCLGGERETARQGGPGHRANVENPTRKEGMLNGKRGAAVESIQKKNIIPRVGRRLGGARGDEERATRGKEGGRMNVGKKKRGRFR